MSNVLHTMQQKLAERAAQGNLRQLKTTAGLTDFCSNDYLGLAHSETLRVYIKAAEQQYSHIPLGATGSRLLSGNHPLFEELEETIATSHRTEILASAVTYYILVVWLFNVLIMIFISLGIYCEKKIPQQQAGRDGEN